MPTIELYLNDQLADTSGAVRVVLAKEVADYRNPNKKTGEYSLTLKLPQSASSRRLFAHEDDAAVLGKFRRAYAARVEVDGVAVIEGTFTHRGNEPGYFVGNITGTVATKIGGILPPEKTLRDIQSFNTLLFHGAGTVAASLNDPELAWAPPIFETSESWSEVAYPYVADSFARLQQLGTPLYLQPAGFVPVTYEQHGVSHFVGAVMQRVFQDAGYTLHGDVLQQPAYRKLLLLYSNEDGQPAPYNYGTLCPMTASAPVAPLGGYYLGADIGQEYARTTDLVLALTYPFEVATGDEAECLGADGVYTAKYTGQYQVQIQATADVTHVSSSPSIPHSGFTCLRCISDDEFIPDTLLPNAGSFATPDAAYLDAGTLLVGDTTGSSVTVQLQAGKQYAVQRYISLPNNSGYDPATYLVTNPAPGTFTITACDGPVRLDPAKFLPAFSQADFVRGVLKLFNLYPLVDAAAATVTLYQRDAFFALQAGGEVNLTPYCDTRTFAERPFTNAEVGEMSLRYTDDNDFLSLRTDLPDVANASAPEDAYELPFAPLGFVEVPIRHLDLDTNELLKGIDLLPCILPDADPANSSLLTDFTAEAAHAYKPRIALYEAGAIQDGLVAGYFGEKNGLGYTARLTFFGLAGRKYKLVEDTTLRLLSLVPSTDPDIYTEQDTSFLRDPDQLTDVSLAIDATDPAAQYASLYRSDRNTIAYAHFLEGSVRLSPALYGKLNGKGVLRIGTGYYLLSGISGYDVQEGTATLQLYVHVP